MTTKQCKTTSNVVITGLQLVGLISMWFTSLLFLSGFGTVFYFNSPDLFLYDIFLLMYCTGVIGVMFAASIVLYQAFKLYGESK